jgi:hypothetical protein
VREIQTLQAVGFALEDTRPFVECLLAGNSSGDACPNSVAVYRRKLAEVDACMRAAVRGSRRVGGTSLAQESDKDRGGNMSTPITVTDETFADVGAAGDKPVLLP